MNRKKSVIFDLDGVLVDTAKYHYMAWRKLANDLGFDISLEQNEQLKGISREKSLQKILNWGDKMVSQKKFNELMTSKNREYQAYIAQLKEKDLLPGVLKVLNYLSDKRIPFALSSTSKNAKKVLAALKIEDRFSAIVDGNEIKKAKPNPEIFFLAAEKLKTEPKYCVVFEDSVAGVKAANLADMTSIGIGDKEVLKEADFVFSNFTEIDSDFMDSVINKDIIN